MNFIHRTGDAVGRSETTTARGKAAVLRWGKIAIGLLTIGFFLSCGQAPDKPAAAAKDVNLKEIANQINDDFLKVRKEVSILAQFTASLYLPDTVGKNLSIAERAKYQLHENGVFYKPLDDGRSAVFVSGKVPVTEDIKKIVYFTEPLDAELIRIVKKYPEVAQAYYNDRNSYNRIYPYFDVITQYEPRMDIPAFNFYYLADEQHDPEKKAVWVNEPYVDPAGRGWMVSAIAPVYHNGRLEGVPGLDVMINTITSRYIDREDANLIILDASGTVVSIPNHLTSLLSLPPLEKHKYLETIRMDTYRTDDFNLLKSRSREVREMAVRLINEHQKQVTFKEDGKRINVICEPIPELDWMLLRVIF